MNVSIVGGQMPLCRRVRIALWAFHCAIQLATLHYELCRDSTRADEKGRAAAWYRNFLLRFPQEPPR